MSHILKDEDCILLYREGSLSALQRLSSKYFSNSGAIGYKTHPESYSKLKSNEFEYLFAMVFDEAVSKYSLGKGRFKNFFCECLKNAMKKAAEGETMHNKLLKNAFSISDEPKNAEKCVLEDSIEDVTSNDTYIKSSIDCKVMKNVLDECIEAHGHQSKKIFDLILKGYSLTEVSKVAKIPYYQVRKIVNLIQSEFELIMIRDYNIIVR